jgi:hypothetical protein
MIHLGRVLMMVDRPQSQPVERWRTAVQGKTAAEV